MSTRSKLLLNVLRAWDQSVEGALYLDWLVESDPALDGGLVLREAVLEWNETEEPASEPVEKALAEFCARLSRGTASAVRAKTAEMVAARSQIAQAIRESVRALRKLRQELGCGRLEALNQLADELQRDAMDESQSPWRRIAAVQELSAKTAALRRTSAEPVDLEGEWQRVAADVPPPRASQDTTEELDRYYSYQLVDRLEQIAERASALDPIQLKVTSEPVKDLFQAAHEVYLYGFDVACIALCRSLIDHALKDRLSVPPNERPALRSLIDRAQRSNLLDEAERHSAEEVEEAGNKAMHNLSNLRRTAGEVLACTRKVLNKLYAG
ncbi:MAG: hypothetical protein WA188_19615 [Terriglobales bacterium]